MDIDINKPVENPQLSKLLKELAAIDKNDADLINAKYNEITREFAMNAYLLSVINISDEDISETEDGQTYFKEGAKFSLMPTLANGEQHYLGVFTDWIELRKGEVYKDADVKTLILTFDDYYEFLKDTDSGIVINPFGDFVAFSNENLKYMKQRKDIEQKGHTEIVTEKETEVLIAEPADYPYDMADAIANHSKNVKEINAIWLKLMVKGNEQSYLLIVDYDGDRESIFAGIADAAKPFLQKDMFIDMVPYSDSFGKSAATGKPVYKKKNGFFSSFFNKG